jgi:hypothetical protein
MTICENKIGSYLSVNVTEDEVLWDVNSTYNNGDEARDNNYIYKYAGIDGYNSTLSPENERDIWIIDRPTNYWSMLSENSELVKNTGYQTQKTDSTDLVVEFTLSNYNTLALLNVTASTVLIELINTSTSEVIETTTYDMIDRDSLTDAYLHYFSEPDFKYSIYHPIQVISGIKVKITVSPLYGTAGIGRAVLGFSNYLGETLFKIKPIQTSYTSDTVNEFGTTISTVNPVYNPTYTIKIPSYRMNGIMKKFKNLAGKPLLFIGDETDGSLFENLLTYGLWSKAQPTITNLKRGDLEISIQDLT